jgi:hypothetical protein
MPHPNPERRTTAPPGFERLLAGLTPEQAQAVTHGTGPLSAPPIPLPTPLITAAPSVALEPAHMRAR